jgi:hypothetical protein
MSPFVHRTARPASERLPAVTHCRPSPASHDCSSPAISARTRGRMRNASTRSRSRGDRADSIGLGEATVDVVSRPGHQHGPWLAAGYRAMDSRDLGADSDRVQPGSRFLVEEEPRDIDSLAVSPRDAPLLVWRPASSTLTGPSRPLSRLCGYGASSSRPSLAWSREYPQEPWRPCFAGTAPYLDVSGLAGSLSHSGLDEHPFDLVDDFRCVIPGCIEP